MKNFKFLFTAIIAVALSVSSCSTGCDEDFVCENNGTPVEDGVGNCMCECEIGFGGENCQIDYCADLVCENNGEKVPTEEACECNCPDGFQGADCSIETRGIFLGNYTVDEDCDGFDPFTYETQIVALTGGTALDIEVRPLFPDGVDNPFVPFTVESETNIKLVAGTYSGYVFTNGTGIINAAGVITMTYAVEDEVDSYICDATLTPM